MNKLSILLALLISNVIINAQERDHRCGSTNYLHYQTEKDSLILENRIEIERQTQEFIKNYKGGTEKTIITIPVVVHVLYNTSLQNISDAQVYSQIDVLNEDYHRLNADTVNTPVIFQSIAADCEIQFCLAKQDPSGNYTTGITRTQTTKTSFDINTDDAKFTSLGGINIWDKNKYLNIWVVPAIKDGSQTGILGYAQFPGGPTNTDGVVIQYRNFGRIGSLTPYYNKGRTVTHEVGHWLNLLHIWGDDGYSCTGSDYVDDTPNQADENYDCPNYPSASCSNTSDMYSNYMDYTDDACMNIFTNGQKLRMLAVMNGVRAPLKTSVGCLLNDINYINSPDFQVDIFPNPNQGVFSLVFTKNIEAEIQIVNSLGEILLSQKIQNQSQLDMDLSILHNGLYFVRINNNNTIITKKIQILR